MIRYSLILLFLLIGFSETFSSEIRSKTFVRDGFHEAYSFGDFRKVGSKYYSVHTDEQVNWYHAVMSCYKRNGNLATLSSNEESSQLSSYLIAMGHIAKSFWLSGSNLGDRKQFFWMTTGGLVANNLFPERAVQTQTSNCTRFAFSIEAMTVLPSNCERNASYICEIQNPKTIQVQLY